MKLEKPLSIKFLLRFLVGLAVVLALLAGYYQAGWSVTQQKLDKLEYQVLVNGL